MNKEYPTPLVGGEILFISDLHIGQNTPEIRDSFVRFLNKIARDAKNLYILGDLFEAWIGDDFILAEYQVVLDALRQLSESGTEISIMHGNRDFLLDQQFAKLTKTTLIKDPLEISLMGKKALLMHGDTLCIDDLAYQKFRGQVRSQAFISDFLSKSVEERFRIAQVYREMSQTEVKKKSVEITDVNHSEVIKIMAQFDADLLIHGHTHRLAIHNLTSGKKRIVLGDWGNTGNVLSISQDNLHLQTFDLKSMLSLSDLSL